MKFVPVLFAAAAIAAASPAVASPITGNGSPTSNSALTGATVINFDTAALGTSNSKTFGDLTIVGRTTVDNDYAGDFNTFGARYLQNDEGDTNTIVFNFGKAVSAFGFNLGAADYNWTLTAGGQTYSFSPTNDGNAKNFYGISGIDITSATLKFVKNDYVLIDNISYKTTAAVPEPAAWVMMLFGFGVVGFAVRKAKSNADARFEDKIRRLTAGEIA